MKVAFVSIGDPRDPHYWSGIPYHMLHYLIAEGCDVEIIAPLRRNFRYLYVGHKTLGRAFGMRFDIDRQPFALRSYRNQIVCQLARTITDVVFSPSSVPVSMLDGNIPVIYWTDAVWENMVDYYEGFSDFSHTTRMSGHRQEQTAMDRAALAIYSSNWAATSALNNYKVEASKVSILPFGANMEVKHSRDDLKEIVRGRGRGSLRLLFLGVDWKRKGGQIAVDAARLLNEAGIPTKLFVVGCDPDEAPAFVEKFGYISKRNEAGKKKLEMLLASSHFLILPTRAEAAGIVFCEASAFGLPAITTDTSGIANYISDSVNGMRVPVEAGPQRYANEILRIFQDPVFYEQLCLSSFHEFKNRLNWTTSVAQLVRLMSQCV